MSCLLLRHAGCGAGCMHSKEDLRVAGSRGSHAGVQKPFLPSRERSTLGACAWAQWEGAQSADSLSHSLLRWAEQLLLEKCLLRKWVMRHLGFLHSFPISRHQEVGLHSRKQETSPGVLTESLETCPGVSLRQGSLRDLGMLG